MKIAGGVPERIRRVAVGVVGAFAVVLTINPPARAQAPLPAQAAPRAAAETELTGELEVEYEDSDRGARLLHYVHANGRRVRLQFAGTPPDLRTGARVRARGRLADDTLALAPDSGSMQALSAGIANTLGPQRTIVILVNFQNAVSTPYAPTTAASVTFQTTSNFFLENTYGQTSIVGDVFGWFTIAMDNTSCDSNRIASLADQAATAAGAVLSSYNRKIYAFPNVSACGWWGLGSVGGNPSRSWINGSYALKVVAHELGHNFGALHSHSRPCDPTTCTSIEYGDSHDVMGNPSSGHMNAFQKERLGWLNYGEQPPVQVVGTEGAYRIDAMSTSTSTAKALKILKDVDAYGRRTFYYVETRARVGADANIAQGVIVHTGSEASAGSSYQVDLLPGSTSNDFVLDTGQIFNDPGLGLWLMPTAIDATGATVDVRFDGAPCVTAAPTVAFSPSSAVWVRPGSTVVYTVEVANHDTSGCDSSTFTLDAALPSGWTGTFSPGSLSVAPGARESATFSLQTPSTALGRYGISFAASRTAGAGSAASGSIVVASALDVTLSIASGRSVQLTSAVKVGSMPVAGVTVTFTLTNPNGVDSRLTGVTDASGTAKVTVRLRSRDPRGTYRVAVAAATNGVTGVATGSFSY